MPSTHVRICLFQLLLIIPIYFIDKAILSDSGGGWVPLNFEGLFVITYSIIIVLDIIISSIALSFFKKINLFLLHLGSVIFSIGLIIFFFYLNWYITDNASSEQILIEIHRRESRKNIVELKEWWYEPDLKNPQKIYVRVKVSEAGRFAGNITGLGEDSLGLEMAVLSSVDNDVNQRQVKAGEDFIHVFPMATLQKGYILNDIEIALNLFKDSVGYAQELDISKIYTNKITTEDDGAFFYAALPKPSGTKLP
jgi:hypothetical protein